MEQARLRVPRPRERTDELHVLQRPLPAVAASARLARVTVGAACRAWRIPDAGEPAALVASELIATAVQCGSRGQLTLRLLMSPDRLRLELHDPSGRVAPGPGDPDEPSWPLEVVAASCRDWGVEPLGGGTQLFAELSLPAGL